jgi:hypothetical protein
MKALCLTLGLALMAASAPASESGSGIHFDHALHVEDVGLACTDCHTGVEESQSLAERLFPEKSVCGDCHDVDDMDACGTCHVDADDPTGYAGTAATVDLFNHQAHLDTMACEDCHGGAPEYASAPEKTECRTCHATVADFQDCQLCHSQGRDKVPESHEGLWESWHGMSAGSDVQSCSNCHVQDDCQQCHAGDNVRPRVHPLNFEFNHSIKAKANEIECATCHEDPQFCGACHAANFVVPQSHAEPGWRNGAVHGPEALFEIESCISCHDAGEAVPATCSGSGCHQGG